MMKKILKKIKLKIKKSFTIYDFLVLFLALFSLVFIWMNYRDKDTWVEAGVKITAPQLWYDTPPPPHWIAENLKVGDKEYSLLNEPKAEIIDMFIYDIGGSRKEVFLKVKLKSGFNSNTKQYSFKGQPVAIGSPIELNIGKVLVQGLITYVADTKEEIQELLITGKVFNVYPWQVEAIKIGDVMSDGQGRVIAKIEDKKEELADYITTDWQGNVFIRKRPDMRDVTYEIKIQVKKVLNNLYFRQDQLVQIGNNLWLQFDAASLNNLQIIDVKK